MWLTPNMTGNVQDCTEESVNALTAGQLVYFSDDVFEQFGITEIDEITIFARTFTMIKRDPVVRITLYKVKE
jgi:hypothetical protein